MKIGHNTYQCDFCKGVAQQQVGKYISSVRDNKGKSNVTDQVFCRYCGNYISQNTKRVGRR